MPRNINRRVETLFPLESDSLIRSVKNDILAVYLADTVKARRMNSDGTYSRVKPGAKPISSQDVLLDQVKTLKKTR